MVKANVAQESQAARILAELAAAACCVAGRHGGKGAFIDDELDLWDALQGRLRQFPAGGGAENLGTSDSRRK
jgi:hypothetical protein